jgi:hypothetical protein
MGFFDAILLDTVTRGVEKGHKKGLLQGEALGLEKGIPIGFVQGEEDILSVATANLLQEGYSVQEIATLFECPLEKILKLKIPVETVMVLLSREIPNQAKDQHKNVE